MGKGIITAGVGFGSVLAMILSHAKNGSILWAIIHGLCGWLYVIWRIFIELI